MSRYLDWFIDRKMSKHLDGYMHTDDHMHKHCYMHREIGICTEMVIYSIYTEL